MQKSEPAADAVARHIPSSCQHSHYRTSCTRSGGPKWPPAFRRYREVRGSIFAGGRFGRLRSGAIGVLGAVVISMAFMGPATAVFFNTNPMAAGAG